MAEYRTVDARGLKCPMPIVKAKKEIDTIPVGEVLKVIATDPGSVLDFQGWMKTSTSYELVRQEEGQDEQGRKTFVHLLRRKA
ncbi:MAG TPA: sulfurtransferase TusA family protein [Methylomirabilota bacterium]|jgi:TusA-related sulfurtransferase